MDFIEKFSGIFLIAGIFLFFLAIITLGIIPAYMVNKEDVPVGLPLAVPEERQKDFASLEAYHDGLRLGRDIYIKEACWHCHSQFVRPTANENLRYGPISTPGESQNELNLPQLFGTRRVGPDLSREAGKKSDDWHYAHLYEPTSVVPQSVMPEYSWYFELDSEGVPQPKPEAKALVAYLQWLGSNVQNRQETVYDYQKVILPPRE